MKQKCSKQDLLINGSISKALIWFALPLLGSSFIQLLYNAVDLIFIGNYVGKSASAAVGSGSLLSEHLLPCKLPKPYPDKTLQV